MSDKINHPTCRTGMDFQGCIEASLYQSDLSDMCSSLLMIRREAMLIVSSSNSNLLYHSDTL